MSDSDGTKTLRTTDYVAMLQELHQLRAEVERLSDELNAEKFRTCERCVEKTATSCAEIADEQCVDSSGYSTLCDTAEAIRKEYKL